MDAGSHRISASGGGNVDAGSHRSSINTTHAVTCWTIAASLLSAFVWVALTCSAVPYREYRRSPPFWLEVAERFSVLPAEVSVAGAVFLSTLLLAVVVTPCRTTGGR